MAGWATVLPKLAADENGAMATLTDSLFAKRWRQLLRPRPICSASRV